GCRGEQIRAFQCLEFGERNACHINSPISRQSKLNLLYSTRLRSLTALVRGATPEFGIHRKDYAGLQRMPLDRIDAKLLSALQSNNRLTSDELAEFANLSPTACQRRVKRL